MKVKLFDETEIEAQVKEEKDSILLVASVSNLTELSELYDKFTNMNLANVVVTYTDDTYSEYSNLKIVDSSWIKKANVISVTITLSTKTEFEMKVDELNTLVNSQEIEIDKSNTDVTKTQLAIVEIYELLLPLLGL